MLHFILRYAPVSLAGAAVNVIIISPWHLIMSVDMTPPNIIIQTRGNTGNRQAGSNMSLRVASYARCSTYQALLDREHDFAFQGASRCVTKRRPS